MADARLKQRIHDRLVDLVRLPSVAGEEYAAVARIAQWLQESDVDVHHWSEATSDLRDDPGYPGGLIERAWTPVVAGIVRGRKPGPTILLTGHVDVVPPGPYEQWSFDPFGGYSDDDRVWGRGTADMKAGVVAALDAFERFAGGPRDFPGRVVFIAVGAEEDSGLGTLAAIRRGYRAHAAILTEPTIFSGDIPSIAIAHAGAMEIQVHVPGRGAHASRRLTGESALDHYLGLHAALRADEEALNQAETHPLMKELGLPYPTNVGVINGGRWSATVMESLDLSIRIGVPLGESIDQAEARFRKALEQASAADPWFAENPLTVTRTASGFGSAQTDRDHPLVSALTAAAAEAFGTAPPICAAPYGCDMAGWVRLADTPTVLFGPGELDLAHAADESVSLDCTVRVADAIEDATRRLLELDVEPLPEIGIKL